MTGEMKETQISDKSLAEINIERRTSVSSVRSRSAPLPLGEVAADRPHSSEPCDALPFRCRPAFSLSSSVQESIEERRDNISKRFGSARGVTKKESSTFVTRRLSTVVSVDDRRSRRKASIKCSFMITAELSELDIQQDWNIGTVIPS